jgi:S-adenosyl-L-methionine hydrolase (adenosine-forming)
VPAFKNAVISLTTDFGLEDPYVGVMKGVILSVNPEATIVDLSHGIPSHDILAGALTVLSSCEYFPANTIHVTVVDPGVGSERRPILAITEKYAFLGPDNGVFAPVLRRMKPVGILHLTEERYFRSPVSQTFHGRDVFASVAAHLSLGTPPERFGRTIEDLIPLKWPLPRPIDKQRISGEVLRVDKFGNLITNISAEDLAQSGISRSSIIIRIGNHAVTRMCLSYAEASPGEPFGIIGSSGLLEISVNQASAARQLGVENSQSLELAARDLLHPD